MEELTMKYFISIIFCFLFITVSLATAGPNLIWNRGNDYDPAGYVVGWGASSGNYTTTMSLDTDADCVKGTDPKTQTTYDCSYPVPEIAVGQTIYLSAKAFNNNEDGSPCPTCYSGWATPVAYTNNGSGQNGTKPEAPTNIRLMLK
jgi:hypothetical protein